MTYKHFSISIVVQAILLACTPLIMAIFWSNEHFIVLRYLLFLVYIGQIIRLIKTVRKTNRELAKFIEAFGFGDTTIVFRNMDKDNSFQDLFDSFNSVVEAFRHLKMEKEKEYLFFENALKNMDVAILVVNQRGDVLMSNASALQLFGFKYIHRINKLDQFKPGLATQLLNLKPQTLELIEFATDKQLRQVTVSSVMVKQDKSELRLLAFRDIHREIQQKEMESWQKLIRVLTHEVMNSLSPVTILSAGLKQRIGDLSNCQEEEKTEWLEALDAIQSRSKGLTRFVENYRSIAGLQKANPKPTPIYPLLKRVETLFHSEIKNRQLKINIECSPEINFSLDEKLMEQVLINLLKNSLEAVEDTNGNIQLQSQIIDHQLIISVSDNGSGIPQSEIEKVCIPFYTTKEQGSGVGLALTQQVMRLHGGNLQIKSNENEGTCIKLTIEN